MPPPTFAVHRGVAVETPHVTQPFRPDSVTPRTRYRCRNANSSTIGRIDTAAARNSRFSCGFCAVSRPDSATWTVHESGDWAMISGHRNAFQLPITVIAAIAAKKPFELGTTI